MKKLKKILILLFILLLTLPTQVFAGTYYPDYNLPDLDYGSYRELKSQSNNNYEQWLGYNIEEYPGYSIVKFRVYAATTNASFYWAEDYDIWAVNSSGQTVAEDWFRDSTCNGSSCSKRGSGGTWYKYTNGSMDLRIDGAGSYTVYIEDNPYDNQQVSTIGRLSFGITVKPATVQLSYNGNGATSGSVATATVNQNTSTTVANNGYAKTGYLFKNWNLNSAGTSTAYNPGASIYMNASKTLYAQWSPITWTIHYIGYNATGGSMSDQTCTYDQSCVLKPNGFTRTGYDFLGYGPAYNNWQYNAGQDIKNITTSNGSTINMVTIWDAHKYNLSFNLKGGTATGTLPTQAIYDQHFTVNNPTRRGYIFKGWTITGLDGTTHYIDNSPTSETTLNNIMATDFANLTSVNGATIAFTANWEPTKYQIEFNPLGGTINGSTANVVLDVEYDNSKNNNVSSLNPNWNGWEFFGWYTTQPGKVYQVGDTSPSLNKIYNANGSNTNDGTYWKNNLWFGLSGVTLYGHWKDITKPNVTIEQYQPTIYKADGSLNYTNQDVVVKVKIADGESGLDRLEVVSGSNNVLRTYYYDAAKSADENYVVEFRIMPEDGYYLRVYDKAGNYSTTPLAVPTIDKVDPELDGNNMSCGITLNPEYMTVAVKDDYSGIDHWKYAITYVNEFNEDVMEAWVDMPGDQLTANIGYPESLYGYITIVAYDKAGNEGDLQGCAFNYAKQYDSDAKLVDFAYIFANYREKWGSLELTDTVAEEFIVWLETDDNMASNAALKYIQRKVRSGSSKTKAVETFLNTYGYSEN